MILIHYLKEELAHERRLENSLNTSSVTTHFADSSTSVDCAIVDSNDSGISIQHVSIEEDLAMLKAALQSTPETNKVRLILVSKTMDYMDKVEDIS